MAKGMKTGGRQKGSLNKATSDVKAAAQQYTAEAIQTLAKIMRESETDAARVAAAKEILDRGHGKSRQFVDVDATIREADVSEAPISEDVWLRQAPQIGHA